MESYQWDYKHSRTFSDNFLRDIIYLHSAVDAHIGTRFFRPKFIYVRHPHSHYVFESDHTGIKQYSRQCFTILQIISDIFAGANRIQYRYNYRRALFRTHIRTKRFSLRGNTRRAFSSGHPITRTFAVFSLQSNYVVMTAIASTLAVGSITVFNLANNIQHFPIGIIGISFAIAAFPALSQLIAENNREKMIDNLSQTMRQIIFFIIPLSIIFLLLRAQIVRVVLGSGEFSWTDTILTANTLAFFSLSLFAQSLIPLLIRVFFALKDTWTPFLVGLIASLINIIAGLYLKNILGVSGLALAFSLSMTIQLVLLWFILRTKLGDLRENRMLQSINKISFAALVMAIFVQFIKIPLANLVNMNRLWGIMTQGAIAGIFGLLIYGLICYVLKLEEILQFISSLQRRFVRIKNVQSGEITEANE